MPGGRFSPVNRRDVLRGAFGMGALRPAGASLTPAAQGHGSEPNVLMIMADQLIPHLTGTYGHPIVRTPNMDRLAARGVRFDAAYTPHPLCAPARACLMTGRLSSDIGVYDNAAPLDCDEPTVAHYLDRAGYDTAIAGKMHFVGPDQYHGFRRRLSHDIYPEGFDWTKPRDHKTPGTHARGYVSSGIRVVNQPGDKGSKVLQLDEEAHRVGLDYLRARGGDGAPFFLTVSYNHPHEPFHPLREFWDLYEGQDIPIPKDPADYEERLSIMDRWLNRHHGTDKINVRDPKSLSTLHRAYYAMVSYFDDRAGQILDALEQSGLAQNTVVILTGDHGDMLGQRGMVQKRCFYEWSARVPMLLAFPDGRGAGGVVETPVSLVDVFPTILDVTGIGNDRRLPLDGRSLLGHLDGEAKTDRPVFSEQHSEGVYTTCFMVRQGSYKYVHIHDHDYQLFDLEKDPGEWNNLAGNPDYRGVEQDLRSLILDRFDPESIELDLRASLARREFIRDAAGDRKPDWSLTPDPVS